MNKLVIVFVVIVASCNLVHGHNSKKCMTPWGKANFDHGKFSGEWFVVAKTQSAVVPKVSATCNKIVYAFKEDGNTTHVTIDILLKVGDQELKFVSKSQPIYPNIGSITQAAWQKEGENSWAGVFYMSVLATDYKDFAVTFACRQIYVPETDMFDKFQVIEVLSRKPEMESQLMEVLKNFLTGFDMGGGDDEMIKIDNSNC